MEYTQQDYLNICEKFKIEGTIDTIKPLGEGFINDTFLVKTKEDVAPNYILQRKNRNIFVNIPAMMDNINNVCNHLKGQLAANGGNPDREAMTILATHDDKFYFLDAKEEYWTVTLFIENTITYQTANTPQLAFQGGKGIGRFQSMLSDFTQPLTDILPGFHNIRYRFQQWDEALANDAAGRKKDLAEEISWIESRREEMLNFWTLVENGTIPTRVTHNDTKISNILFDENESILCVIDLDTVLNSTCLNDFGDAIRSYTNTGAEDEKDLSKVSMNIEMFKSYTQGYLTETISFLNQAELDHLAFAAKYITYEQVLRFLMDYINGDTYYKVKSATHNLERTHAQYKLLQSMEEQYPQMCAIVTEEAAELKK
ncbi:MAG: phosphotransferase enzyme family protein [Marinifilaceae bacterium]